MKNELELFGCVTARGTVSEKTMSTKELAEMLNVSVDTIQKAVKKLAENNRQVFGNIQRNSQGGYLFNEVQATAIKVELQNHTKIAKNGFDTLTISNDLEMLATRQIDTVSTELEENEWYTIEELAALCGYDARTLKHSENNLASIADKMSLNLEVNTQMGGYHNTQKFYSKNVLKALKEYQLKNSVPNAMKDKETAISGNVSFVQTETVKQTINNLLDNPNTIEMLLQESLKRTQALGIENKQLKDIVEKQKPKVEYFDSYMDATNLSEIGQLGKVTKIGERNIFKVMVADGYIRGKCVDGIFYYVPNYGYERYFETIPVPFMKQGKQLSRDKLMLTKEGFVYFTKKYKSN